MLKQHYDQPLSFNVQPPLQPSSGLVATPIDNKQQQQELPMLDQTASLTSPTLSGTAVSTMLGGYPSSSSLGHPTDRCENSLHVVMPQLHQQQQLTVLTADSSSSLPSSTLHIPNEQQQQQMNQPGLSQVHDNNPALVTAAQDGLVLLDTTVLQQQQPPHVLTPTVGPGSGQTTPLPSPLEQHAVSMVFKHQRPFLQQHQQEQAHQRHTLQQQHDQMIQDMIDSGSQRVAQNTAETTTIVVAQQGEAYNTNRLPVPLSGAPQTMISSQPIPVDNHLDIHHQPGRPLSPSTAYDSTHVTNELMIHEQQRHSLPLPSGYPQGTPPAMNSTRNGTDNYQQHIGKYQLHDIPLTAPSSATTADSPRKIRRHTMSTPYPTHLNIPPQKGPLFDPTMPHSSASLQLDGRNHHPGELTYAGMAPHHNNSSPSTPIGTGHAPTASMVFEMLGNDEQKYHQRNTMASCSGSNSCSTGTTSRRAPGHLSLPPPPTPQELFSKIQSAREHHQTAPQAPVSGKDYESMSREELIARLTELEHGRRKTAPSTATNSASGSAASSVEPSTERSSIESSHASAIKEEAVVDSHEEKAKEDPELCSQANGKITKSGSDSDEEGKYRVVLSKCAQQQQECGRTPSECLWENCGRSFESLQTMISHISEEHVGGRKSSYSCVWKNCRRYGKAFTKRHKMFNHLRTHTGERPYVCTKPDCYKRFSRPDSLSTHIKTHSNVRPYICPVQGCGRAYYHARSLNKHGKTHMMKVDNQEFLWKEQHPLSPSTETTPCPDIAGPMPGLEFLHSQQQQRHPVFQVQSQGQQQTMPLASLGLAQNPHPSSLQSHHIPQQHKQQQQQQTFIPTTPFHPQTATPQQQSSSQAPSHQQQQQQAYTPLECPQQQVSVMVTTDAAAAAAAAAVADRHTHSAEDTF